jgi:pilus assembly protein CpaB
MSARNIILVVAAVLMAAGTAFLARDWLNSQRPQVQAAPQAPKIEGALVLVAAADLPAGILLQDKHLRWQIWPSDAVPVTYFVKPKGENQPDPVKDLLGAVVRKGITTGEPVSRGRILQAGARGFLAAVLRPGFRAMSIQVTATAGIAGLVFPGDRIDLILTHAVKRGGTDRRASETVLTNLRVLAIDQSIDDQAGSPRVFKNATLELTPKQTEMLAVLGEIGRLSMALRSLAKDEEELERLANSGDPLAEPEPARGLTYTWDTEVSRLLWRPSASNVDSVQVSRGNETKVVKFRRRQ